MHNLEDIDLDEDQRVILGVNPQPNTLMDTIEPYLAMGFVTAILLAAMGALGGVAQALMSF